jgi:hypothetical protein
MNTILIGKTIRILNRNGASWLEEGKEYIVESFIGHNPVVNKTSWSESKSDWEIVEKPEIITNYQIY